MTVSNDTPAPAPCDTELAQKFFETAINDATRQRDGLIRQLRIRRGIAYVLKGISLFGAIVVAAKLPWIDQTALGLIIAAAVGLDQLTSNHARLLAIAGAEYAYDRLLAKVKAAHSGELLTVVGLRKAGRATEGIAHLNATLTSLTDEINQSKRAIVDNLRQADLKALDNLYVDQKK